MKKLRTIPALIGSLALMMALPAIASAGGAQADPYANYEQETFRVTVKGWTKSVDQNSHAGGADDCDVYDYSSGSERVNFRSVLPRLVTAVDVPGQKQPLIYWKLSNGAIRLPSLPVAASVTRSFTRRIGTPPMWCNGTGGGQTLAEDCGTRKNLSWDFNLSYDYASRDSIVLMPGIGGRKDPFANCRNPGAGAFPFIPESTTAGKRISAELPKSELFDRSIGKIITIARGKWRHKITDYFSETEQRWEISLVRVKEKKR